MGRSVLATADHHGRGGGSRGLECLQQTRKETVITANPPGIRGVASVQWGLILEA